MNITSLESIYNIPELVQRLICIVLCCSFHRMEVDTRVLKSIFTVKQYLYVIIIVSHYFTQYHVFQPRQSFRIFNRIECLKRLVEIGISGFIILIFSVQNTTHLINLSLQCRGAVDGICTCSRCCQRSFRFRKVLKTIVEFGLY